MHSLLPWILALLAFGLLVLVHELGHFLVCRAFGVRVEAFSIGFGPKLWGWTSGGTEFKISALPLGGFVKLAGELQEEDGKQYAPDEFMGKPWWVRSLVLLAGPAMNFLVPVLALALLYATLGKPVLNGPALVRQVMAGKPAAAAGFLPGDMILRVEGQEVSAYAQMSELVGSLAKAHPGQPLAFAMRRDGHSLTLTAAPALDPASGRWLIGVVVDVAEPPTSRVVDTVIPGLPAEKAGFAKGDEVLSVAGHELKDGADFKALFAASTQDPVPMSVSRAGKAITLLAAKHQPVPEGTAKPEELGLLGMELVSDAQVAYLKVGIFKGPLLAGAEVVDLAWAMSRGLWDLITLKVAWRDAVGGPITILRMAHQQAQSGFIRLLDFSSKISVMLCVMNLLPIPMLDGGTLLQCVIEGVRGRRLSLKVQGLLQNIGLGLLALIFIGAFYNDIAGLFTAWLHHGH
jgi:regulator of sigma E protease